MVAYHRSVSEKGLPLIIVLPLSHISLLDAATCVTGLVQRSSNGKILHSTAKVTVEKC